MKKTEYVVNIHGSIFEATVMVDALKKVKEKGVESIAYTMKDLEGLIGTKGIEELIAQLNASMEFLIPECPFLSDSLEYEGRGFNIAVTKIVQTVSWNDVKISLKFSPHIRPNIDHLISEYKRHCTATING